MHIYISYRLILVASTFNISTTYTVYRLWLPGYIRGSELNPMQVLTRVLSWTGILGCMHTQKHLGIILTPELTIWIHTFSKYSLILYPARGGSVRYLLKVGIWVPVQWFRPISKINCVYSDILNLIDQNSGNCCPLFDFLLAKWALIGSQLSKWSLIGSQLAKWPLIGSQLTWCSVIGFNLARWPLIGSQLAKWSLIGFRQAKWPRIGS